MNKICEAIDETLRRMEEDEEYKARVIARIKRMRKREEYRKRMREKNSDLGEEDE